ncbi:MAG: hypothetical protein U9Q66_02235 [Patescibacteria group bacterium]|nr:hypothetical protein [Patescibacteria group bacterium]
MNRFISNSFVAFLAVSHSFWIIFNSILFGNSFLISSIFALISSVKNTAFVHIAFQKPIKTASFQLYVLELFIFLIQYLISAISSKYVTESQILEITNFLRFSIELTFQSISTNILSQFFRLILFAGRLKLFLLRIS